MWTNLICKGFVGYQPASFAFPVRMMSEPPKMP